jgi:hypothetical protein
MTQPTALTTVPWNNQQRAMLYAQSAIVQKDEVIGVLLALFFGSLGLHHFYLRRNGLGILYLLFCWTGIPAILGFFECFLMPGRVRRFNLYQAQCMLAGIYPASFACFACGACGARSFLGSRYCGRCGCQFAA